MKTLIKIAILSLTFILIKPNTTQSQCHIDDWTALKALYESTDGDNWTDKTDWQQILGWVPASNCDLSLLYGISLDENGRVTCIDFDGIFDCDWSESYVGNNLVGTIPT